MTPVRLRPGSLPTRGSLAQLLPGVDWPFELFVPGKPAPQGSKHARPIFKGKGAAREFTGKVAQVESSKSGVNEWRGDVRRAAIDHWACSGPTPCAHCVDAATVQHVRPALDGALILEVEFVRQRPAGAPKSYTPAASTLPDTSKLVRSTEDALTSAGIWRDDARVVATLAWKRIAEADETPGAWIRIGVASDEHAGQAML